MASSIPILIRSSSGISSFSGTPDFAPLKEFDQVQSKSCRSMVFSSDGSYLAYVVGSSLKLFSTNGWREVAAIENVKSYYITFSPKSTFLISWEPFTVSNANPQGSPNLKLYKTEDGRHIKSFIQKKQINWELEWSQDEKLCTRLINNTVEFFEGFDYDKPAAKISGQKVSSYKISPNNGTYFVLCYCLGSGGQPSVIKLFKYPNFDEEQAIVSKSFFQADKVDVMWNLKGNNALLLTSTEVDKTGGSYYGKQGLHFIALNGQCNTVTMNKEGPIYSVQWSPRNDEFCAIYGFMPAKATIFNLKCEPVYELGTGARNAAYYNPFGNILLLGGFGNLRGHVEIWDATNKKKIGSCEAPDTTHLQWAADGEHFVTSTTAPRLRTANGFKIWHYSGALLHETDWPQNEELYEVSWKPYPKLAFREPQIEFKKVEGIASSQPQASKEVYRPPGARNRPFVTFSLHNEDEAAHKVGGAGAPSKAALKNKKKREAKKAKQNDEDKSDTVAVTSSVQITLTGDPEVDKKLKNIKKKLDAIEKLKKEQASGKTLELNQLMKIEGEAALIKELEQLSV
ncbi:eukaryotic translation initiation factor 2A [Cylas formicarius]|uniref:eukaryotic translation initiation factor 2A n=1 Tax=Cylas formicarius TaxID=197179 RepID=UPI00295875E3|nr:eukaryotic translation initiation factor 2A [Cylas formicarius]